MSISNPVAAEFGGGGPRVPPGSLCLSITLLILVGIFEISWGSCPGGTCVARYPDFLVPANVTFSTAGVMMASYTGSPPFFACASNFFISVLDTKNSSSGLVSVVWC